MNNQMTAAARSDLQQSNRPSDASRTALDLMQMSLPDLREEWRRCHPDQTIPRALPRDLLARSILWTMQAEAAGGFSPASVRTLERLATQLEQSADLDLEREIRLKPGTRLIREWRNRTYRVEVLEQGFLMDGRQYVSLSHAARAITGTKWSGPRFFGLKQRSHRAAKVMRDV